MIFIILVCILAALGGSAYVLSGMQSLALGPISHEKQSRSMAFLGDGFSCHQPPKGPAEPPSLPPSHVAHADIPDFPQAWSEWGTLIWLRMLIVLGAVIFKKALPCRYAALRDSASRAPTPLKLSTRDASKSVYRRPTPPHTTDVGQNNNAASPCPAPAPPASLSSALIITEKESKMTTSNGVEAVDSIGGGDGGVVQMAEVPDERPQVAASTVIENDISKDTVEVKEVYQERIGQNQGIRKELKQGDEESISVEEVIVKKEGVVATKGEQNIRDEEVAEGSQVSPSDVGVGGVLRSLDAQTEFPQCTIQGKKQMDTQGQEDGSDGRRWGSLRGLHGNDSEEYFIPLDTTRPQKANHNNVNVVGLIQGREWRPFEDGLSIIDTQTAPYLFDMIPLEEFNVDDEPQHDHGTFDAITSVGTERIWSEEVVEDKKTAPTWLLDEDAVVPDFERSPSFGHVALGEFSRLFDTPPPEGFDGTDNIEDGPLSGAEKRFLCGQFRNHRPAPNYLLPQFRPRFDNTNPSGPLRTSDNRTLPLALDSPLIDIHRQSRDHTPDSGITTLISIDRTFLLDIDNPSFVCGDLFTDAGRQCYDSGPFIDSSCPDGRVNKTSLRFLPLQDDGSAFSESTPTSGVSSLRGQLTPLTPQGSLNRTLPLTPSPRLLLATRHVPVFWPPRVSPTAIPIPILKSGVELPRPRRNHSRPRQGRNVLITQSVSAL